ncbi:GNAT family N-acetyltransferase [Kribbella sp. NPDC006257]|uniref:GNAT family N-acetyltransferase n=1 Tax=Kribbella sp. NPDC006257 TaxID=3156738 RepID=UPI0033AA9747
MTTVVTDDVSEFRRTVLPYLQRDPIRNAVLLEELAEGNKQGTFVAVIDADEVVGAVLSTPRRGIRLGDLAPKYVEEVVGTVVGQSVEGLPDTAADFADRWPGESAPAGGVRLYRLRNLRPRSAVGSARVAKRNDLDTIASWIEQMVLEAGDPPVDGRAWAARQAERLWLWEIDGEPVSLAGRRTTIEGVTRIGPIYTSPEFRRHGYGAALTSHLCSVLRDAGSEVCLRTDLANPASHSIYQAIGFEPVVDYHRYTLSQ